MTKKGWNGESQRHSLAKKGIKTKSKPKNKLQTIRNNLKNNAIWYSQEEIDGWHKMGKTADIVLLGGAITGIQIQQRKKGSKYTAIADDRIIGDFNTINEAIETALDVYVSGTKIIPMYKGIDIRNLEYMPRGLNARYLEVIEGLDKEFVAKQWRRKSVPGVMLIDTEYGRK